MAKTTLDEHCGRMEKDYTSRRGFTNHVKTHSEEIIKCPKCPNIWEGGPENQFNTKKALVTHMFEYHSSENKCSDCDKTFSTASNLKKHESSHQNDAPEVCSKCKKTFASTFSLQHHVKSCFTQLASKINLSCEKCEKQFESVKQLKRHLCTSNT